MITIRKHYGFTLTELIIVIVIVSILSAVVGPLIGNKFTAVDQSSKRASWVQQSEFALFHLRQDLSSSVPNSTCTTELNCADDDIIEFLGVNDRTQDYAARYRDKQRNPYDRLNPNNDGSFDVFGKFDNLPSYVSIGVSSSIEARDSWQAARVNSSNSHIARISSSDSSLIEDDNNAATNPNPSITNIVLVNSNHNFPRHSPYFRAYFTDGPIGYECKNNILYRVSNYNNLDTAALFSTRTATAVRERIADNVTSCSFQVRGGSPYQAPTVEVKLSIGQGAEKVTLNDIIILGNGS